MPKKQGKTDDAINYISHTHYMFAIRTFVCMSIFMNKRNQYPWLLITLKKKLEFAQVRRMKPIKIVTYQSTIWASTINFRACITTWSL